MTGHAMPWNKEPSGQQKEDSKNARQLAKDQSDLMAQQKREMEQRRRKLNTQQVAMLRSRFGVSGGSDPGSANNSLQSMSDTSSSLFARLTGG